MAGYKISNIQCLHTNEKSRYCDIHKTGQLDQTIDEKYSYPEQKVTA